MNPRFWVLKALKFLLFGTLFVGLAGYVTMTLWNHLIPDIFHGPLISFWQALGLLVLARLLTGFKPGGGGWGRQHQGAGPPWANRKMWRKKMEGRLATMTDEQRAEFRARMAKCGPRWARWTGADAPDEASDAPVNQPG